jgi:hypothetical protein
MHAARHNHHSRNIKKPFLNGMPALQRSNFNERIQQAVEYLGEQNGRIAHAGGFSTAC